MNGRWDAIHAPSRAAGSGRTRIGARAVVAVCLAAACAAGRAEANGPDASTEGWGPASSGLQLGLAAEQAEYATGGDIAFRVSLRNLGTDDVLIRAGEMRDDGRHRWTTLELHLADESGSGVPAALAWGAKAATEGNDDGRVLTLPLRAGARHDLAIAARDVSLGGGGPIPPGSYRLSCRYRSGPSPHETNASQPRCWGGSLESNVVSFRVRGEKDGGAGAGAGAGAETGTEAPPKELVGAWHASGELKDPSGRTMGWYQDDAFAADGTYAMEGYPPIAEEGRIEALGREGRRIRVKLTERKLLGSPVGDHELWLEVSADGQSFTWEEKGWVFQRR